MRAGLSARGREGKDRGNGSVCGDLLLLIADKPTLLVAANTNPTACLVSPDCR